MELIHDEEQNNFQTFSCGDTKVTFTDNGYIVEAKNFMSIMWGTENLDEELIGKHIIELADMLKKYGVDRNNYISFLENVVLKFYERKTKDSITKDCRTCQNMSCRVEQNEKPVDGCIGYINHNHDEKEESGKQLVKTHGGRKIRKPLLKKKIEKLLYCPFKKDI